VTAKHTIQFKKITAIFLLLVLFAVTLIQVTHTHATPSTLNKQEKGFAKKSRLPVYYRTISESKCFICEYQLTKDADATNAVVHVVSPVQYHTTTDAHYSFTFQHTYAYFETRGPPSAC